MMVHIFFCQFLLQRKMKSTLVSNEISHEIICKAKFWSRTTKDKPAQSSQPKQPCLFKLDTSGMVSGVVEWPLNKSGHQLTNQNVNTTT